MEIERGQEPCSPGSVARQLLSSDMEANIAIIGGLGGAVTQVVGVGLGRCIMDRSIIDIINRIIIVGDYCRCGSTGCCSWSRCRRAAALTSPSWTGSWTR